MSRQVREDITARWGVRGTAAATIAARLTFDAVTLELGGRTILNAVTLDVEPGAVVCLLGPSGCGKTTLLRIAAGIETPSSGRVLLNDAEISGPGTLVPPENRNIGLMFQDFALFPHLTILQNVAFGLRGLPREEILRTAESALVRVGLAQLGADYPHILSGGEQQRVALARAIAPRPGVLLMDEPFSGLDVNLRESMQEETLAVLRETRATSMLVTHDPLEAMRMGHLIAVMQDGGIVQAGTPEAVYHKPDSLFVARFFSDMNEIRCPVRNGYVTTPLHHAPLKAGHIGPNQVAVVCVRERGVHLVPAGEGQAGRVLSVGFLGDAALVELAVQGLDEPVRARVDESGAPKPGDDVSVAVQPGSTLVFGEDDDATHIGTRSPQNSA